MPAPTVTDLPELPTFPTGPGLPHQPGVFIPMFLAFHEALRNWPGELADLVAYLEGLSGGGSGDTSETDVAGIRRFNVRSVADSDLSAGAYALASSDVWAHLRFTSASPVTLNVNQGHGFLPGDRARFTQAAAGQVTMVAGNGVTLNSADNALTSQMQNLVWELECVGLNEFDVLGLGMGGQPVTFNFSAAGDASFYADVAMILTQQATSGTGSVSYEKSTAAAPSTFSSTTSPITLEAGAWLRVTAASVTTRYAVHLKRTA